MQSIHDGYKQDCLFKVILEALENYTGFKIRDNLIFSKSSKGDEVLCVPHTLHEGKSIPGIITNKANVVLGHMGMKQMMDYVHHYYWWPLVSRDINKCCSLCSICLMSKTANQKLQGLLNSLPIPRWPWE